MYNTTKADKKVAEMKWSYKKGYGIINNTPNLDSHVNNITTSLSSDLSVIGIIGVLIIFLRAFSLGAGTYTGLEAVSNGLPIMREPKVQTGKKTMLYMAISAPQVQMLREVRDNVLFSTGSGATFMTSFNDFYYAFSPAVADLERQSPLFKEIIRITITPMLSTLSVLNYVDINSEQEMLGYGIGIILMNVGMYFVAPAIIILKLRKYVKF